MSFSIRPHRTDFFDRMTKLRHREKKKRKKKRKSEIDRGHGRLRARNNGITGVAKYALLRFCDGYMLTLTRASSTYIERALMERERL